MLKTFVIDSNMSRSQWLTEIRKIIEALQDDEDTVILNLADLSDQDQASFLSILNRRG